jgi:hypothetical protein
MDKTYSLRDLLLAVIDESQASQNLFPGVVAYYGRRSSAFQDAFGMHFTKDELPLGKDTRLWDELFSVTIKSYLGVGTPFSHMFEMPRSFEPFVEAFDQPFAERAEALRQLHLDFLVVVCERWYGDRAKRTITSPDLLACGFDDSTVGPDIPF